jgi:hypothetical protein
MSQRGENVAWSALVVIAAGTVFEALVALELVALGDVPGPDAAGFGIVLLASMLVVLVAWGAAFALHSTGLTARSSGPYSPPSAPPPPSSALSP